MHQVNHNSVQGFTFCYDTCFGRFDKFTMSVRRFFTSKITEEYTIITTFKKKLIIVTNDHPIIKKDPMIITKDDTLIKNNLNITTKDHTIN